MPRKPAITPAADPAETLPPVLEAAGAEPAATPADDPAETQPFAAAAAGAGPANEPEIGGVAGETDGVTGLAGTVPPGPADHGPEPLAGGVVGNVEIATWLTPPTAVVQGPAKGRRRIGRMFGAEPVSIAVTDLTEAEFAELTADPELFVSVVDVPH